MFDVKKPKRVASKRNGICMISGFRRGINEICSILGFYAA